jgi:hypothetical protein
MARLTVGHTYIFKTNKDTIDSFLNISCEHTSKFP